MKDIRCNICGKTIMNDKNVYTEDVLMVTKDWGYFSKKDGKRHRFCICESCYDDMIQRFVIPVCSEDITEFM